MGYLILLCFIVFVVYTLHSWSKRVDNILSAEDKPSENVSELSVNADAVVYGDTMDTVKNILADAAAMPNLSAIAFAGKRSNDSLPENAIDRLIVCCRVDGYNQWKINKKVYDEFNREYRETNREHMLAINHEIFIEDCQKKLFEDSGYTAKSEAFSVERIWADPDTIIEDEYIDFDYSMSLPPVDCESFFNEMEKIIKAMNYPLTKSPSSKPKFQVYAYTILR